MYHARETPYVMWLRELPSAIRDKLTVRLGQPEANANSPDAKRAGLFVVWFHPERLWARHVTPTLATASDVWGCSDRLEKAGSKPR